MVALKLFALLIFVTLFVLVDCQTPLNTVYDRDKAPWWFI